MNGKNALDNHIPSRDPILFYEIDTGDASEFKGKLKIHGVELNGYKILRTQSPAVPNAIAALLLHLRNKTGKIPHVYFGWSEGNPLKYLMRYIAFRRRRHRARYKRNSAASRTRSRKTPECSRRRIILVYNFFVYLLTNRD